MAGSTSQRVYEISDFKGLNLHDEARKIAPGEFTSLINASTDNNAIKADAVDALINMPVPVQLINTMGDTRYEFPWLGATATATWDIPVAIYLSGYYNGDESTYPSGQGYGGVISVLAPFYLSASSTSASQAFWKVGVFPNNASGSPSGTPFASGADFFTYKDYQNSNALVGTATGYVYQNQCRSVWEAFAIYSQPSGVWVEFQGVKGLAGSGVATAGITAKSYTSASGWATTNTRWSCVISKYSNSNSGHVLNIIPMINQSNDRAFFAVGAGGNSYTITSAPGVSADICSFGRFRFNGSTVKSGFKVGGVGTIGQVNQQTPYGVTGLLQEYADFNLIQNNSMISFSAPENSNGMLIDYFNDGIPKYTYTGSQDKYKRKIASCYFNGYVVYARNGKPLNAILLSNNLNNNFETTTYTQLSTPTFYNPRGVISYNNFLMFYNVVNNSDDSSLKHRMYFSTAGMVDAFASNQYENLSDGQEILWIEEWYGSLIVFFADRIKRYTGTPGNATLETIFYRGVSCAEVVCKTGRGIFFVSTDGLYLYNGTFQRIMDWSTKFDQANSKSLKEDGWLEFNDKSQELYFYPGYNSVVNVWNAKHNFFRQKDYTSAVCSAGMRFFKYYHNMDLKTAISYPSITHVSQVEAGTTYQAINVQSGWIDVSEGQGNSNYEQKRFDRCIIEYSGQTAGAVAQVVSVVGIDNFGDRVITLNNSSFTWINADDMVTDMYAELVALIVATGEPVTCTYITPATHDDGIYITANTPGVPFTFTYPAHGGTLVVTTVTANTPPTDYFDFIVNFDDGTSKTESSIQLFSTSNIVSKQVMLDRQAKLVQYKITSPAQTNQVIVHKIKFYYDDTMLK